MVYRSGMVAILIFSPDNAHPLSWMLRSKYKHVEVRLYDEPTHLWLRHNFGELGHEVTVDCHGDYPIQKHYRDQGMEVVAINCDPSKRLQLPLSLNNCVGMAKSLCGINTMAVTPQQLYNHVRKSDLGEIECTNYAMP